jgi:hypothetical protein
VLDEGHLVPVAGGVKDIDTDDLPDVLPAAEALYDPLPYVAGHACYEYVLLFYRMLTHDIPTSGSLFILLISIFQPKPHSMRAF